MSEVLPFNAVHIDLVQTANVEALSRTSTPTARCCRLTSMQRMARLCSSAIGARFC